MVWVIGSSVLVVVVIIVVILLQRRRFRAMSPAERYQHDMKAIQLATFQQAKQPPGRQSGADDMGWGANGAGGGF